MIDLDIYAGRRKVLKLTVQNADDPLFTKGVNDTYAWNFTAIVRGYPNATLVVALVAPLANGLSAAPAGGTNPVPAGSTPVVVNINYNGATATPMNPVIGQEYYITVKLTSGGDESNIYSFPVTFQP